MVQCGCIGDRLSASTITESIDGELRWLPKPPTLVFRFQLEIFKKKEKATLTGNVGLTQYHRDGWDDSVTLSIANESLPRPQKRSELQNRLRFEVKRRAREFGKENCV